MSQTDEDVAAVLGLPREGFDRVPLAVRRRGRWRIVGVAAGVMSVGAAAAVWRSELRPIHASFSLKRETVPSTRLASHPAGGARPILPQRTAVPLKASSQSHVTSPEESTPPTQIVPRDQASSLEVAQTSAPAEADDPNPPAPVPRSRTETLEAAPAESSPALPDFAEHPPARETAVRWLKAPDPDEVADVYPTEALAEGRAGSVVLSCRERVDGTVDHCEVLRETPPEAGFGRAALRLSRNFLFAPVFETGRAVEAAVTIPYDFSVLVD